MWFHTRLLYLIYLFSFSKGFMDSHVHNEEELFLMYRQLNVTPSQVQLFEYREKHKVPLLLTTSAGKPVDLREVRTLNSELLTNAFFMDSMKHTVQERIPERIVHAKGTGAFGYLEVTNDITKYSKARLFEKVGKRTPLAARFSSATQNLGGNDVARDIKGLAIKFYTEDGNLDILCTQMPVYLYRDPILFSTLARSFLRNPKTNLRDIHAIIDFVNLEPNALHSFLRFASPVGIPKNYRFMNGFPIHVYELSNARGESYFAKFKFLSNQGVEGLTNQQARLVGVDPDFYTRDLYNAIKGGQYPSWRMEMDVMTLDEIEKAHFEPFDVTRTWPNGTYRTVPIGQVVINKNVENFFAQVEQAAYNPANLVPGIPGPHDQLFKGRVLAYTDTQIYRLGINRNKIDVNCPMHSHTYNRDGPPPVHENMGDAPNYFPNSFHGPEATVDESVPKKRLRVVERTTVNLVPAAEYFRHELNDTERTFVVNNVAGTLSRVLPPLKERFLKLLLETDTMLGESVIRQMEELAAGSTPPPKKKAT